MGSSSISVKNKWVKTKWLMADPALRRFVPETKLFRRSALNKMVRQYRMIYYKPVDGTGGNGIARIERTSSRKFKVKKGTRSFEVPTLQSLHDKLRAMAKRRGYLIQKGIYLKKSGGRPFDIRVMMQKSARGRWVPSGTLVKLGLPNRVATNYHQGGSLRLIEPTMRRAGYSSLQIKRYRRRLNSLGLRTARCFQRRSANFKELGLDVALDRNGRLWILEVNTRPNIYALKTLSDKRLYHTVVRYGKQYGRTK